MLQYVSTIGEEQTPVTTGDVETTVELMQSLVNVGISQQKTGSRTHRCSRIPLSLLNLSGGLRMARRKSEPKNRDPARQGRECVIR